MSLKPIEQTIRMMMSFKNDINWKSFHQVDFAVESFSTTENSFRSKRFWDNLLANHMFSWTPAWISSICLRLAVAEMTKFIPMSWWWCEWLHGLSKRCRCFQSFWVFNKRMTVNSVVKRISRHSCERLFSKHHDKQKSLLTLNTSNKTGL